MYALSTDRSTVGSPLNPLKRDSDRLNIVISYAILGGKEHIYLLHRDYIHVAISSLVYPFFFSFLLPTCGFYRRGCGIRWAWVS